MKNILHSLITLVPALGFAAYTVYSASTAGLNADSTVVGFSFLAIVGIIETGILTMRPDLELAAVKHGAPEPRPATAVVPVSLEKFRAEKSVTHARAA